MEGEPNDLLRLVQSGWPQILAIFYIVWWARRIDLRAKDHTERMDRHDARLRGLEQNQHAQAILQARIEESLSGIKLTLDRIYSQIHNDRG